jgi:hypothetical protein
LPFLDKMTWARIFHSCWDDKRRFSSLENFLWC